MSGLFHGWPESAVKSQLGRDTGRSEAGNKLEIRTMSLEPESSHVRIVGGQRQKTNWSSGTTSQMSAIKLSWNARKSSWGSRGE